MQVLIASTYDYIRNTCLHYIDELELVLCRPRLWLLHDECYPTKSPIQCLRAFHILFLLSYCCYYCYHNCYCYCCYCYCYCYYYCYFYQTIILLCYWSLCCRYLVSRCGWIDNSAAIPLCRINKFGLNTLPSKTIAIPYTCGLSGTLMVNPTSL